MARRYWQEERAEAMPEEEPDELVEEVHPALRRTLRARRQRSRPLSRAAPRVLDTLEAELIDPPRLRDKAQATAA